MIIGNRTATRTALCLALALCAMPALAAQEELKAEVIMENDGPGLSGMTVYLGADGQLRLDMASPQGEVSMVLLPTAMLMIMHSQQMYMEFDKEMLDRMQQMMGGMGQEAMEEVDSFDPSTIRFTQTGKTDTINDKASFEVEVEDSKNERTSYVWMTANADYGLFEIFARMLEPLSAMRMPGMGGGGGNPLQNMQKMMQLARAQGMPAGKVIRVMTDDGSMTLGDVVAGPLGDVWSAPSTYTKQAMPMMRQR